MRKNEQANPHGKEKNQETTMYNIRNFGAVGDGKTIDTAAINAAIKDCHANGGGTVYMPPGIYLSGSIRLKSHIRFFIDAGATLKGSPNLADYKPGPTTMSERGLDREKVQSGHLLLASGEHDISLEGAGTIDGGGEAFFDIDSTGHAKLKNKYEKRPSQMVCFYKCSNIRIKGLNLNNPTFWTPELSNSVQLNAYFL